MLKTFYKLLLVSLLSGSLLMLDFSYKGIQISPLQAETLKTEKAQDGDLASTLTMTAVGFIASRLYSCKLTTDMMIAAAAGIAFLAGEVTSFTMEKKALKDQEMQIFREKNGQPTQLQITLLQRLKESYQDALKTANAKKNFQNAARAAFLMASAAAAYQAFTDKGMIASCMTSLNATLAPCTAAATCPGTCCATCPGGGSGAVASAGATASKAAADEAVGPSAAKQTASTSAEGAITATQSTAAGACPIVAGATMLCKSAYAFEFSTRGVCMKPLSANLSIVGNSFYANYSPIHPEVIRPNIFEILFMPNARADLLSPMGIASSAAINYFMLTSATLGVQVDMFLFSPLNRSLIWMTLAGLTSAATSATDKQIGTINENIKKIDKILNEMNALQNGVGTSNVASTKNPTIEKEIIKNNNIAAAKLNEIDFKAAGAGKLPCITSESSDKCPSLSEKLNQTSVSMKDFPDSMQAQIGMIGKMADGLSGQSKISGSTLDAASTLAGQANAIKSDLDKRMKDLQDIMKKSGSTRDLVKESADLAERLNGITTSELQKRKTTASEMYANFSGSKSAFGSSTGSSSAVATDANKDAKKDSKKMGVPVVAIPAATSPKLDLDKEMSAKLLEDKKAADEAALAAGEKKETTMDDYVLKNDITQDKDTSIFELISNRYQKSGYPRLFKRIK